MRLSKWSSLVILYGSVVFSAVALEKVELPKEIPDEPFDIQTARLEYTNDTFIASGGVTGRFENVMVRADRIEGNSQTGDLKMEGHVRFERGNALWQGSVLDYNYITQLGNFGPSSFAFDPVLLSVEQVERVTTNEYRLRGAVFTTCPKEHPHFRVYAKEARLVDEDYLEARGVTVYLGTLPVFHWPYWYQKLDSRIFSFSFGFSSEWGAFAKVKATVPITQRVNWISDINSYSRRGVGLGQGLEWDYTEAKGGISAFYLKDENAYDRFMLPPVRDQIGDDRYSLKFDHQQNFNDAHYINTKWNYLSDPAFLEEFFKREFRQHAQPENYGSWVFGNSYGAAEGFVSQRLNDFYDNVNRAEYSADLFRTRLGNTPLFFQSKNAVSHLERVYSETNTVSSAYDSVRIDSDNALSWPQRYGFLRLVPRVTYRATYYSKTTAVNGGGEEARLIPGAGMELAVQATKVLSDAERWYGKGLRHKIEPYADYQFEESNLSTNRVLQFDDVDERMDRNRVKMGLRNVLQTRRAGRTSRFIDLDLYTYYLVDKEARARNDFESLFIDARMPLTQHTMVDVEGEFDGDRGEIPFFNTRISHRQDEVLFSLEYLHQQSRRSLWTPRVDLFPEGDVSFEAFARYDDNENDLQEIGFAGYKNWCCMRYGLGARFYDDNEFSVLFSFGLSAFPEARISSGF